MRKIQKTPPKPHEIVIRAPGMLNELPFKGTLLPPDQNPLRVYLMGLAPESQRTMHSTLQGVVNRIHPMPADEFPWWKLRYQHLLKLRADMATTYAATTVNKTLVAIRQVLRHCRRLNLMTAEDCAQASDVPSVRGSRLPPGRALTPDELKQLLEQTHEAPVLGIRNRAILMLLACGGLRRSEVSHLALAHYHDAQGTLDIHGKGNKQRQLPLHQNVTRAFRAWIRIRGNEPGPLFYRGIRGDRLCVGEGITAIGIYSVVVRLGRQADVLGIRPHDFRRTFISVLLDEGKDLAVVSQLVGHSNVATTTRYDRRGEPAKKKAIDGLDALFRRNAP